MKRKLIAVLACFALLAVLGGCNGTGGVDDPATSPSASASPGANGGSGDMGGNVPNNAGGTANNGGSGDIGAGVPDNAGGIAGDGGSSGAGTGTVGGGADATDGLDLDGDGRDDDVFHTDGGSDGSYHADDGGAVDGGDAGTNGRMRSVGNDLRDMVDSAGRAVRDIL